MRAANRFSSWAVTVEGAMTEPGFAMLTGAPPPLKEVWVKLARTRRFRFSHQFRPTLQLVASVAEKSGLEKAGNALSSTSNFE